MVRGRGGCRIEFGPMFGQWWWWVSGRGGERGVCGIEFDPSLGQWWRCCVFGGLGGGM